MLVLSRRRDEKIVVKVPGIDEGIEVIVVQIDSSRVRLGFTAPQNVTILRSELQVEEEEPPSDLHVEEEEPTSISNK